eukprot:m.291492 g.291492  ORF g.291492 m.291492 type:complete len:1182 (+) comp12478_c0_seq1:447-3992(+)
MSSHRPTPRRRCRHQGHQGRQGIAAAGLPRTLLSALPVLVALALGVLLMAPLGAEAGARGSSVERSKKISDAMPRFMGPSELDVTLVAEEGWDNDQNQDYAKNIVVLGAIGIIFAFLTAFWCCGSLMCGCCCSCWRCDCCVKRKLVKSRHSKAFYALWVFLLASLALCIYGYESNSDVHKGVNDDSGIANAVPNVLDTILVAIDDVETEIDFISANLTGVADRLRTVTLPAISADVNAGTTDLLASVDNIRTELQASEEVTGEFSTYSCTACTDLLGDFDTLRNEITSQTDSVVADFQSTVDSLDQDIVDIEADIQAKIDEIKLELLDVRTSVTDSKTDVIEFTDQVKDGEDKRRLGFIILFLMPLLCLIFVIIATIMHRPHLLRIAVFWTFFYVFLLWIIFAVHVMLVTVSADACVYWDNYETTTLASRATECEANELAYSACPVYKNAKACIFGESLVEANNATEQLDFSNIEFPEVPNITISFTFDELTTLRELVDETTPTALGVPECYLTALFNDINGDFDVSRAPPRPTPSDALKRALWLQDKLGLDLPFPHATTLGTHNSYNRHGIRTHIDLDTTYLGSVVKVDEIETNQIFTMTDQLNRLGVRFLEVDAHFIEAGTGSGVSATQCQTGATDFEKTRVCHANSGTAADIETGCLESDWSLCESLCVCDYGPSTACGIDPPELTAVFGEINNYLDTATDEVVAVYVENKMNGRDSVLNDIATAVFGTRIFVPTVGIDYGVDTNWPSRATMLGNGKKVVLFTTPSTTSCTSTGPASNPDLSNFFCQAALRDPNRINVESLTASTSACNIGTQHDLTYVTGTVLVVQVILDTVNETVSDTNGGAKTITAAKLADIKSCGLSPDLDQIDETLAAAALWSWKENFPATGLGTTGAYAEQVSATVFGASSTELRWQNVDKTSETIPCACRDNVDPLTWTLAGTGDFASCATACSVGSTFAFPRSSKENAALHAQVVIAADTKVWINMECDNAGACGPPGNLLAWPDHAIDPPATGVEVGGSILTRANIAAAVPADYGTFQTDVENAQKLNRDIGAAEFSVTQLDSNTTAIETSVDNLQSTWENIQDVVDGIETDTKPAIDAAQRIVDIFDSCLSIDDTYFSFKKAFCEEAVAGAGGITAASFFLGLLGGFLVILLGLVAKEWTDLPPTSPRTKALVDESYF